VSENEKRQLENLIRATITRLLAERETPNAKLEPKAKPVARLLVGICCGDCLSESASAALDALRRAGFELIQPEESEFKKRAAREKLVESVDGVLLPAIGDDDAAKMANGIFDEPVARVALSAIATGKPLLAALHSPYAKEIKTRAPQLYRVWESHKTTLESFGFVFAEHSALPDLVRQKFAPSVQAGSTPGLNAAAKGKILITASEVETAAKNGASLKLPLGAIVTPLARDRAKELNVKIN
jgi:hypothetical protein